MTGLPWNRRAVVTGSAFAMIGPLARTAPTSEQARAVSPVSATPTPSRASWALSRLSPGGIVASEFNNRGLAAMMNGQLATAEDLHRTACKMWKKYCWFDNTGHALLTLNLAAVLARTGRHVEAQTLARRALACIEREKDAASPTLARGLRNTAAVLANVGCLAEAEVLTCRARDIDTR